jgi:hypothetical protein
MKRTIGIAVVVVLALFALAPAAVAARSYGTGTNPPPGPPVENEGPSVEPNVVTPPSVLGQQVTQQPQVKSEVETLPFTGADVLALVLAGGVLVLAGVALVRSGRRARPQTA